MKTQAERYRYIRERTGLSQKAFAESLGIQQSLSSYIESGAREASREVLSRLASVYRVNLNWYLMGSADASVPGDETAQAVLVSLVDQEVAAGRGVDIADYPETRSIPVPRELVSGLRAETLRAVTVRGDSMVDRAIFDRDIVIFDPLDARGDSVSVVSVSGQLLVKHVVVDRLKGTVTLVSANPLYPPRVIAGPELEGVAIEGRVVACLHRM